MLSVLKLVSCKPKAARELDLSPPKAREAPNVLNESLVIKLLL